MSDSSGKGAPVELPSELSVDVSAEIIQAALDSVERSAAREGADLGEVRVEESSSRAPIEESSSRAPRAPVEESSSRAPIEESSSRAPIEESAWPAPVEELPSRAPVKERATPAPTEEASSPASSGSESKAIAALQKELREAQATLELSAERARETLDRLKESHERHLRAAADLENYKKRAARERDEAERFGVQKLLKDILPVMDNLDRALAHADAQNPLVEGVGATRRLFEDTLGRFGLKSFSSAGQAFDPNRHEAMQQIETADLPPGRVVEELVRGYHLHERLVRPALVTVSTSPAQSSSPSAGAPSGQAPETPAPPAASPTSSGRDRETHE